MKSIVCGLMSMLIIAAGSGSAAAQSYPARPIRIMVGFTPGGVADILSRIIAPKLSESLGQPLVIENRPGAGSNIAAEAVAKSPPDGYNLFIYSSVNAVNVTLFTRMTYDPVKDFAPVSMIASMANILAVNSSVPANSVRQLIALAKARPGALNFGSAGHGTTQHLSGQLFKSMAGIDIVHVPYKGSVQAMMALLSGEIPVVFNVISTVLPQMGGGKIRALAVTSAKRSPMAPDLPTVAEAGLPGFEYISHFGVLAPAATPREIVLRLNHEIATILSLTDTKARFFVNGAEPMRSTPEEFGEFIKAEVIKTGKIVRESGARVD